MIPGWRVEEHPKGDHAEWMAMRQEDLCASEAGALFGRHKYTTERRIALAKSFGEPPEQSSVMRRGKIMEPAVAEAIAVDCGWRAERCETYLRARADDRLVRLGATCDYLLHVDAFKFATHPKTMATAAAAGWERRTGAVTLTLECKSVDYDIFASEWSNGPPAYNVVQAAQQALLADAAGGLIACLVVNRTADLHLYAVPRNPEFEAELLDRAREFWRAHEAGELPEVVALDNGFMSEYFPRSDDSEVVTMDAELWRPLVEEREGLKIEQDRLQDRIDAIEAKLKDVMRTAERAILPGWTITRKTNSRNVLTLNIKRSSTGRKRTR